MPGLLDPQMLQILDWCLAGRGLEAPKQLAFPQAGQGGYASFSQKWHAT